MTLEKFLEGRPELVKKIDACKSEEEIMKAIESEVSAEELASLEMPEIPDVEKMNAEDIANISGGAWYDSALNYGAKALSGVGSFFKGPVADYGAGVGGKIGDFLADNKIAVGLTATVAATAATGYLVVKAFKGANSLLKRPKKTDLKVD